jgi:protein-L-isoaspartate(D-aspartate) O-methyltransferase
MARRLHPGFWLVALCLLLPAPLAAAEADQRARDAMVRGVAAEVRALAAETGIEAIGRPVLDAMRAVPRHEYVPDPIKAYAYANHPLPVTPEQKLAAPFLVALMTELAEVGPEDVVFETGTGAGYHAAVLARLVRDVYSVEVISPLAERAAGILERLGVLNVQIQAGDGYLGWAEHAPYDAIIVKEAIDHVPPSLLRQLKPDGRLVMPLGGEQSQYLTVITKENGRVREQRIMPVRFSPLQGGERL